MSEAHQERSHRPDSRAFFRRICRGCGNSSSELRDHGSWALHDIDSPTGVCRSCAADVGWDAAALALLGTAAAEEWAEIGGGLELVR